VNKFDLATGVGVLRVATTHVVSSDDWVSRSSLVDQGVAIVVRDRSERHWLVSVANVFAPDRQQLRDRAAVNGGPPADRGKVTLVKVSVSWPIDGVAATRQPSGEVGMPTVARGATGGIVAIAIPCGSGLAAHLASGGRNHAIDVDRLRRLDQLANHNRLVVRSCFTDTDGVVWDTTRATAFASRPCSGFAGRADLTAIDLQLADDECGSAVVVSDHPDVPCIGLVMRLRGGQAAMVAIDSVLQVVEGPWAPPVADLCEPH
jgi:hypothetical protein